MDSEGSPNSKIKLSQTWYGKENPQSLMINTYSSWCWNKFANNAAAFQQWEFQSQTVLSSILYTFHAVNELGMSPMVDDLISLKQVLK